MMIFGLKNRGRLHLTREAMSYVVKVFLGLDNTQLSAALLYWHLKGLVLYTITSNSLSFWLICSLMPESFANLTTLRRCESHGYLRLEDWGSLEMHVNISFA